MNRYRRYELVLAVYLNTRGFAFVVFEGPLSPVDWGVKEIRGRRKNTRCLSALRRIFNQYEPAVLVLQDTSPEGTRRARRIEALNAAIFELAKRHTMPVFAYSRDRVRVAFSDLVRPSKQTIAEVIAKHIPAFERYLPPPRKPWMSEDSRMGLFDAAALVLTFFQSAAGGEQGAP